MPTRALTRQLLPAPRPPPRTRAPARWWEVPDASETDRRGDAPEAATRRAERRRETVDARLGKRKKRVNGPSRVRRPSMTERSATTTTTTRSPAPPRQRERSIFSSLHRRENLQRAAKEPRAFSRPAAVTAAPPPRVSRRGPRRRRPPRRAAIPKRARKRRRRKTHSPAVRVRGRPPAWRSRSAPRAAGETTASPSRPLVPRRGATGRGGAGTRERPRAFWGKARDASSRRRRLRQPPFPKRSIGVCAVRSVRRRVVLRPGVSRVGLAATPQTVRGCAVFVRAARRGYNSFGVRSGRARRVGGVSKRVSRDERRAGNEVGVG